MSRLLALALMVLVAAVVAPAALGAKYIVLYKQNAVPSDVGATVAKAGGALVYAYPQIGVAIASSTNASFRANLLKDSRIENASSTAGVGYKLPDVTPLAGPKPDGLVNAPASDADTFSALQWDMRQIHAPEAHLITGGSPQVLVGDIDTGLDFTHPDLAPNVDSADSANCLSGAPVPGAVAAADDNGHGTHTAGTIAAAANGIGIVGVAPNVRISGIKAGDADGFFFPEAVVCAFMWAGSHHFDVTNNSYFADPYYYNCHNDPTQQAIWKAESRAIRYAMDQGVSVVAAAGNFADDLAHPTQDILSPDTGPGEVRAIRNNCVVIPAEVPGVITVSADSNRLQPNGGYLKAYYSNYGQGVISVTAPGGDDFFGPTAEAPNGMVLSTWPTALAADCPTGEVPLPPGEPLAAYCYLEGTSMASPHVAGVAALVISWYGKKPPGQIAQLVQQTADPNPCPSVLPPIYDFVTSFSNGAPQVCTGGDGNNSWYGHGQVNALRAITNDRSQSR